MEKSLRDKEKKVAVNDDDDLQKALALSMADNEDEEVQRAIMMSMVDK